MPYLRGLGNWWKLAFASFDDRYDKAASGQREGPPSINYRAGRFHLRVQAEPEPGLLPRSPPSGIGNV